jgi:16S rRNA (guanine(1405)-N(7))-methyltransferase
MVAGQDGSSPTVEEALAEEANAISRRYRVDEKAALAALWAAMRNPSMAQAVEAEVVRGRGRGAARRRLAKEARKHVYHDLRRYTANAGRRERLREELEVAIRGGNSEAVKATIRELLESHASTRERLLSYEEFDQIVAKAVGRPRSIVDLGCGLHPLAHRFGDPERGAEAYLAIDKDPGSIRVLEAFAGWLEGSPLIVEQADLEEVDWEAETERMGVDSFDLAYLLKLVPVLQRQQPAAMSRIAEIPARVLVVTGSKEALARHEDISRREEQVVKRFVEGLSPAAVTRAETNDEIVYVVRR